MKTIQIEFIGLARILTRQKYLDMLISSEDTYLDILQRIADRFPILIGQVISPGKDGLIGSNMINLNGEHMIPEECLGESPDDGARIIFMSILAGG
jgi:hypothetical protein